MLERWKTVASVHNYTHMRPTDYASFVDKGTTMIARSGVTNCPDFRN